MKQSEAYGSDNATPTPVVGWEAVVNAYDPVATPSRGRYRTVRAAGKSTPGVSVHLRNNQRAAGSQTVHSVLVVLAAHALRNERQSVAERLLLEANQLELSFASRLKSYLVDHSLQSLSGSAFYGDLVDATSEALRKVDGWRESVFAEGSVESIGVQYAHLRGRTKAGEVTQIDLPVPMLTKWNLDQGSLVLVFQRFLSAGVLVEVLPAVPRRPPVTHTGPGAESYVEAAFPLRDAEEIARLRALMKSGSIGKRSLRPAG